jgi:hypothetical protein
MLSSDKNVETISQLIEMVKHNIELRKEYAKLDVVEKVVRLLKTAALILLLSVILLFVLLFASIGLALWLSPALGCVGAFFAVAGIYALILLVIYTFRRPWIERPLVRRLARLLMNE